MHDSTTGARKLLDTSRGVLPHPHNLPYDTDAEIKETLPLLEFIDPRTFNLDTENHQRLRANIRYLAALFPHSSIKDLAVKIHGILGNSHISIEDLRLILQGKLLTDPSKSTREVPVATIQMIGRLLSEDMSVRRIAKDLKVSMQTVSTIENYLGIRQSYRDRLLDKAIQYARDNTSVRTFAKAEGINKTRAHELLVKARKVLVELGEINE